MPVAERHWDAGLEGVRMRGSLTQDSPFHDIGHRAQTTLQVPGNIVGDKPA